MRVDPSLSALALLAAFCVQAGAQHVDILVWDNGGKIGVGQYDYDNLLATETRVHLARFDSFYSVNNPGFTAFAGPDALPGNADLTWEFLPMTVDSGPHAGHASTLLYWDGDGPTPEFGPTPTADYEFSLFGQDGPGTADGGGEVTPGGVIDTTPPNGAIHEHRFYFLDDNGDGLNTTLPAAGVYLVGLRLRIEGLAPSDPVYMVWATPEAAVLPAIRPAALWVNDRVDTLFAEPIEGDFNGDGAVDAADYTGWRDGLGAPYEPSDYGVWASGYGAGAPAGPGYASAAPEPSGLVLLFAAAITASVRSRPVSSFGA